MNKEQFAEEYRLGASMKVLAGRYGMKRSEVHRLLLDLGVEIHPPGSHPRGKFNDPFGYKAMVDACNEEMRIIKGND